MDRETIVKIFDQVQRCMVSLVGKSGHLASYSMIPDSFKITKQEKVEQGNRFYFTARAFLETEFTVYDDTSKPLPELISGSIVLDQTLNIVRDDQGKIMLEPWDCFEMPMREQPDSLRAKVKKQVQEKLHSAEAIIQKIIDECGFKENAKIDALLQDLQTRLRGEKISSDAQLQHAYLEDIYINMIVGIMDQDMLSPQDEISLLIQSIKKRIDHFETYFDQLEKNELKRPFTP
jgi:hypothetical protein